MKYAKLFTVVGLSLLSMQCFASQVVCAESYYPSEITDAINKKLLAAKSISRPTIVLRDTRYMVCVSAN